MRNSEIQTKNSEESLTNRLIDLMNEGQNIRVWRQQLKRIWSLNQRKGQITPKIPRRAKTLGHYKTPNLGIISIDKGELPKSETYKVFSAKP